MREDVASGTAIVGRDAELATVVSLLEGGLEGPRAIVIDGEAGIGKTTLLDELTRAAEGRSYRVLRCRPAEAEMSLPYVALGDLLALVGDEELLSLPDLQRQALEVALVRADGRLPADPLAVGMGLASLLMDLAEAGPLLVAVDDVQWLDADSARILEFAVRRLRIPMLIALARRTEGEEEPVPLALDRWMPAEGIRRVRLGPLSLAAMHDVFNRRLGTLFHRPTLVRLQELSGGNPFFGLAIAGELVRRGREPVAGERLPVPRTLQELVSARLEALSPAARQVLLVASALSRPAARVIEDALGGTIRIEDALIEVEEAGIVTVDDRGRIRFTHPLLASAAYSSASPQRRRRLHGRLAEVATGEERARHLGLSVTGPDEQAAALIEAAGRAAERRGAQAAAAELYGSAHRLTPADRPERGGRRALLAASALFATGELQRAQALAEEAAGSAGGNLRAEALLLLGRIAHVAGTDPVAVDLFERAASEASDDRRLRGRIHAHLSWSHPFDEARAVEHAEVAIGLLDPDEDPDLVAFTLLTKFFFDAQLGRGVDRRLLERGLELERREAEERTGPINHLPLIWFKSTDEFEAARSRFRDEEAWARLRGDEGSRPNRVAQLAEVELRAGNWELAERYIEEACAGIGEAGLGGPLSMPLRIRAMIDAHRGRIDRARETLDALIEATEARGNVWWTALCLSTSGSVSLTAGEAEAADGAFTRMRALLDEMGVVDALAERSQPDHIEALLLLGAPERAADVLARLKERDRYLSRLWIRLALPRCRALIRASAGDLPAALEVVAEAVEDPSAGELPFELARAFLVKGQLHRRTRQKGAADRALRSAAEGFERVGSPIWAARARDELGRVGLRPGSPSELT
ncbi:MAG TPA: AAA family ATPase, partial [Actinomycetota bacterium]|nr:AAA family ATPase [Actinomycetota bacterium]